MYLGILEYSTELLEKLREGSVLAPQCEYECEIRGNSVYAVERVATYLREAFEKQETDHRWNSVMVDFYLYDFAKNPEHSMKMSHVPIHHVLSHMY